jgi:hypothetical protein
MRSVLAALAALAIPAFAQPPAGSPALDDLLARAGARVRQFEQDFAYVISDEDYQQHAQGRSYLAPVHRHTRAEMLFLWLPEQNVWLTVRNVTEADGHAVVGSEDRLTDAFDASGEARLDRLRRLVNESARYNVGRTFRNFNYPTLVLSYLDPDVQPRFQFTLAGRERVRGVAAWKITFVERVTPTIIQGDGADRVSRGAIWIADRDATVLRTQLDIKMPKPDPIAGGGVLVDYYQHERLGMWVPVRMRETYMEMRGSTVQENIGSEATYSNFRRFETSIRILPPG